MIAYHLYASCTHYTYHLYASCTLSDGTSPPHPPQINPNIRAACWITIHLAHIWEKYEHKLQQGRVPNALIPPQRPPSLHTHPSADVLVLLGMWWWVWVSDDVVCGVYYFHTVTCT